MGSRWAAEQSADARRKKGVHLLMGTVRGCFPQYQRPCRPTASLAPRSPSVCAAQCTRVFWIWSRYCHLQRMQQETKTAFCTCSQRKSAFPKSFPGAFQELPQDGAPARTPPPRQLHVGATSAPRGPGLVLLEPVNSPGRDFVQNENPIRSATSVREKQKMQ